MTDLVLERFWDKVEIQPNGCWNWRSSINMWGYGEFWYNSKKVKAHRFAYEVNKGNIPEDLTLDHLCRNTRCANPEHLEAVTMKENIMRGNGIAVINIRKTHCARGHEYTPENTYINPSGSRRCKICRTASGGQYG